MKRGLQKKWVNCRSMLSALLLSALMAGLLTGCGSNSSSKDLAVEQMSYAASTESYKEVEYDAGLAGGSSIEVTEQVSTQKLIKTVDMTVETKTYDDMLLALNQQIAACGGYVENMNSYNGSMYSNYRSSRHTDMIIRIPAENLDTFLSEVSQMSNVVRRNDSVENVTLAYVDLESHKEALQVEQDRLLELLEMAESVEDIITIEERLSNVRYQIESMESQLRTYDNQINYSTVNLKIEEVKELTPVEEETVWERISGGFMDSLRSVGDGFFECGIWLIVNSPILVVWAVIIIAALIIVRRWYGKRKLIKAAKYAGSSADIADTKPPLDDTGSTER